MSKKKQTVEASIQKNKGVDFFNSSYFHYIILFIGCWLVYGWTISFEYNLDDDYILYQLKTIDHTSDGFTSIFKQWYANADYRPITIASFWLQRSFFTEITASSSHFLNVLLFGFLLIGIYKLVVASKFSEDNNALKILALLTSIFFLVHPNHVSVVANVKSRDNILSMLFGVLAAIQFLKAYDLKQYWRFLLFFIFSMLALLSKLDAYSLLIFPVMIILFFRKVNAKKIIMIAGFSLILIIISFSIIDSLTSKLDANLRHFTYGLPENPLYNNDSFLNKISLTITTLFYYLKFLIVPFGYHFYFGYDQIPLTSLFSLINIISLTSYLCLFAGSIYFYQKGYKLYLFCFLFFGISIAYAMNLATPVAGIIMDRYNFIPSLAFCVCLAFIFLLISQKVDISIIKNKWLITLLLIYIGCTAYRTSAWKDAFTLFDRDIPHLKNSVNANRIAGGTYIHLALDEELKQNYNKPLADSFIIKGERYALAAAGIYDSSAQVWELLGLCDLYKRNNETALEKFKKCYTVDTTYLSGINYLGFTYWNLGRIDSAYYYFDYVIKREAYFNYSANNMINMLIKNNRKQEADSILFSLQKRFPNDVRLLNKIQEIGANNSILFNQK